MKKYFLKLNASMITAIFIVVLLVIALSTATYAWFSSNNVVNISNLEFVAQHAEGQGDLVISWDKNDRESTSISFWHQTPYIEPMIPTAFPEIGSKSYDEFISGFHTNMFYEQINNGTSEKYYKLNPRSTTPYVCHKPIDSADENSSYQYDFYVTNLNANSALNVVLSATFEKQNAYDLRVAVFSDKKYVGVLTYDDEVPCYYSHPDNMKKGMPIITDVGKSGVLGSNEVSFRLAEGATAEMRFVIWLDGVSIDDDGALQPVTLKDITFMGKYTE